MGICSAVRTVGIVMLMVNVFIFIALKDAGLCLNARCANYAGRRHASAVCTIRVDGLSELHAQTFFQDAEGLQ